MIRAGAGPEDGSGLIVALLTAMVLAAIGLGLVVLGDTERTIASTYRVGSETRYAAEAGLERALEDTQIADRWTDFLDGTASSTFVDGTRTPVTGWGSRLDLNAMTASRQAQSDALTGASANSPRWRLFAYGPLAALLGGAPLQSPAYVVVWIADDPAETDGNPQADTNGEVMLIAEALGPGGADRAVEAAIAESTGENADTGGPGERGGDALNGRARTMPVDTPGRRMDAMSLAVDTGGMVVE